MILRIDHALADVTVIHVLYERMIYMCTNGVNTGQFKMMLEQMDDQVALNRRWAHKLYHTADNASYDKTAQALEELQHLLDDARAALSDAQDAVDDDAAAGPGVTVNLV
jgi:uncharacterized protein YukE